MEALLATLGTLFALFMVLAAAVEAVLELGRGTLERIGVTWLKPKTTLEEALALAQAMAPDNQAMGGKLAGLKQAAEQLGQTVKSAVDAAVPADGTTGPAAEKLNAAAAQVKTALDSDERRRVWVLKLMAAGLGIGLCFVADFRVFQILAAVPETELLLVGLDRLQNCWLNYLVGGVAAAAGSNYWHDQLDKVRAVKTSWADVQKLAKG
jgi:hypothetical protein